MTIWWYLLIDGWHLTKEHNYISWQMHFSHFSKTRNTLHFYICGNFTILSWNEFGLWAPFQRMWQQPALYCKLLWNSFCGLSSLSDLVNTPLCCESQYNTFWGLSTFLSRARQIDAWLCWKQTVNGNNEHKCLQLMVDFERETFTEILEWWQWDISTQNLRCLWCWRFG